MQKNINTNNLSLKQLSYLRDVIDTFFFKNSTDGEQFHPDYRKSKDTFNKMVYKTVRFRNDLKRHFMHQSEMSSRLVNIFKVTAVEKEEDWLNMSYWDADTQELAVTVEFYISEFFTLGAGSIEAEMSYPIGLDSKSPEGKFLSKYSLQLAGDINDTVKKRIMQQINSGLTLGQNREQIANRIAKIIENPKRANTIAQTESVRAYSEGRLAVGKRLGAKQKMWMTTYKPCPICQGLDKKTVNLDKPFVSEFNGVGYNSPPSHPHCRCLVKLVLEDPDAKTNN